MKACVQDLPCLIFVKLSLLRVFLGFPQSACGHLKSVYEKFEMGEHTAWRYRTTCFFPYRKKRVLRTRNNVTLPRRQAVKVPSQIWAD
jgi:hypothetical protein